MRDEALIYFYHGRAISPGILLRERGGEAPYFISGGAQRYDPSSPGRSAAGFCATYFDLVADLWPVPPEDWQTWTFYEWDHWFGRLNGVFLVDLESLTLTQYPLYKTYGRRVPCDFSQMPGRLAVAE